MLSAAEAQSRLPDFTVDQIRQLLQEICVDDNELSVKTHYLGNLCARGDINKVRAFLDETSPQELKKILNARPYDQWEGSCLHMVGYWNTGDKAIELFDLLYMYGAQFHQDGYDNFPWQSSADLWITPIVGADLGKRNTQEFKDTVLRLYRMYNVPVPVSGATPPVFP